MRELILITVSGEDKPGLTSSLTNILAGYDVLILDIGQAVIHDTLSLGILIEVPENSESSPILKDVIFHAYSIGITINFKPISLQEYENWVLLQGKSRYIVTLMGKDITSQDISVVTSIFAKQNLNIDKISRLSGRRSLIAPKGDRPPKCIEFSVRDVVDRFWLKNELILAASENDFDIAVQEDNIYRYNYKVIVFDMDSTLIQTEVIVELAKYAGVEEEVSEITEAAMRGEIDFDESLRQRVALLKGLDESVLQEICENLPMTDGVDILMRNLKKVSYKTAILSGGFQYFGKFLQKKYGFDYVHANDLEIVDGKLTGQVLGEIVNGEKKADYLREIAKLEHVHLEQTIAVGDGANDLQMLRTAGLGLAFHAKKVVRESAEHSISSIGLDSLLYMIGFRGHDA
ncbi:MAG: phosphoserine phosphatase SerB [Lentisphaeria bacterium]|nr:phosphoserine phosphatase SerB [Lentisphaeria bacterium]